MSKRLSKASLVGMLAILLALISCSLFPDKPPEVLWEKTYGGSGDDAGYDFCQTSDGGFVIAGYTYSSGENKDFYLVKTDSEGNEEWAKNYGAGNHDVANSICRSADGGFVVAGIGFGGGTTEIYLIKINESGGLLWEKTYIDYDYNMDANEICSASDGGSLIVGNVMSNTTGESDVYVMKIDASGDTLWTKTYDKNESETAISVCQSPDGGFVIVGHTGSFSNSDGYVIKTNSSGDVEWEKVYESPDDYDLICRSIIQTSDGGYAIAGERYLSGSSAEVDFYLIKTDASGELLWSNHYGGSDYDIGISVIEDSGGDYVFVGWVTNPGGSDTTWSDCYLIKVDEKGNLIWEQTFGGEGHDAAYGVVETADGSYVLVGETQPSDAEEMDVYLVKTEPE